MIWLGIKVHSFLEMKNLLAANEINYNNEIKYAVC
jgi:hypothetical protein